MTEDNFSTYTGGTTTTTTNNNSNANTKITNKQVNFKIGDKIQVQTKTQGWLDGEIIRYASRKYLIKFKKNFKDSWIPATQLRLKK